MHASGLLLQLIGLTAIASTASLVAAQATNDAPTPFPTSPFDKYNNCTLLPNKDRIGFDMQSVQGSVDYCKPMAKALGAATYTWSDYQGGTCWFKSRVGPLVDKAGVTATDCVDTSISYVCNAYADVDFVGNDIANKPAKAFADCCDICNLYAGCKTYTWSNYNGGTCWLKNGLANSKAIAAPGVTAAGLVPLWGLCPFEYDVDFVGNDVGNKPAKEAGLCCDLCKNDGNCKAYSWSNFNGGTCWLKSGKGQTVKKAGVVSASIRY